MRTILDLHHRPLVLFDPTNKDHRQYVADFVSTGTWAACPVVFFAPEEANTKAYVIESLADYYLSKEFKIKVPELSKRTVKVRFKDDVKTNV